MLHVLALLAVLSVAFCAPVAIISASAKFDQLLPTPGATYQYLYYVTNSTWQPSQFRWDCSTGPYPSSHCTSNCGTKTANAPWCHNPTVPSGAPYGLDLDTWPWQVRWGDPVLPGSDGGVGLPSGFGFRGTYNQGIDNIYQKFWVGEAVHFNNPIWSSGGASKNWTLVVTLYVTDANNVQTSQSFAYRLSLDETLNECDKNDGCPWTSSWWAANPTADTRTDCPELVSVPKLPGGKQCCRYVTITDHACADRVWTLDELDQTKTITVAGRQYTLNIKGFSVPGNDAVQKSYFISQEGGKTAAEIYATLVDACPASCPTGQVIVQGTTCTCQCPATACPTGQLKDASCNCYCPANALNCGAGQVVTSGATCACDCAAVTCTGVKVKDNTNCACNCPAGICGAGTVSNPSDPNCPCSCPACPPGQVRDNRCGPCACPTSLVDACSAASGTFNATSCTCSVCACDPDTPCRSNGFCPCIAAGNCPAGEVPCQYTIHTGDACDPTSDKCIAQCAADGTCVYNAIDCSAQVDLVAKYGEDAPCYTVACNPATGGCDETWHEGNTCTLAALSTDINAPCLRAICKTVGAAKHCVSETLPGSDNSACPLATDDDCNAGACQSGQCVNVKLIDQPCTDNKGCTYLDGYLDPVTNTLSDACRTSPTNPNIAVCTNDKNICDGISIPCQIITCVETAAGAFCKSDPVPYNTSCNDGTQCTVNDVCQRQLEADPDTGEINWVDNGVCEGSSADCTSDNPCLVGRCLEGGGCTYRADVRDDFICGVSSDNCTIYRCDNGTCVESEDVCPGSSINKGGIAGAAVAGAAAIALAVAIGLYARNRIANSKVFDPTTWEQLQAGAGQNNALYERRNTEVNNQLYQGGSL